MGYYIKPQYRPQPQSLAEWIKQIKPELDSTQIQTHVHNLTMSFEMDEQELFDWLFETDTPDSDTPPDSHTPPY